MGWHAYGGIYACVHVHGRGGGGGELVHNSNKEATLVHICAYNHFTALTIDTHLQYFG